MSYKYEEIPQRVIHDNKAPGILSIPDGFSIIVVAMCLLLVKTDEVGKNGGVSAACYVGDGRQELLRRYYKYEGDDNE